MYPFNLSYDQFLKTVFVVGRGYNHKHAHTFVTRSMDLGFQKIAWIYDEKRDNGVTPPQMEKFQGDDRFMLLPMVSAYSWSNALNLGVARCFHLNAGCNPDNLRYRFMFFLSVEALISDQDVRLMHDAFRRQPYLVYAGYQFEGRKYESRSDKVYLDPEGCGVNFTVENLLDSYRHPRNTGAILDLSLPMLSRAPALFDPQCDDDGGMEDLDLTCKIVAETGYEVCMVGNVPLIIDVFWHQPAKMARERDAMDKIFARNRESYKTDTFERANLEFFIKAYRLE